MAPLIRPTFCVIQKIEVGRKEEKKEEWEGGARVQACPVSVADGEVEKISWLFFKNEKSLLSLGLFSNYMYLSSFLFGHVTSTEN